MDQQSKEYQRGIYALQIGHMKGLMLTNWKGALWNRGQATFLRQTRIARDCGQRSC